MTQDYRLPPQDLAAEQSVIGAILLDKNAIVAVADILKPESFYEEKREVNMINIKKFKFKPATGFELYSRYTFDSFVVGASNQSAYNAAVAVVKHPAKKYNPYFIYGGEGFGRTHLMWAIGYYMRKTKKISKVLRVSSERFTNDLIDANKNNKYEDFIKKYMSANVLLVDDIQFMSDRPETKAELVGVIKKLKDVGRQIIITCGEHPGKILTKNEMALIGGKAGAMTEIKPPSIREKIAIANRKIREMKFSIPREVIRPIAKRSSNIRELESILIRLDAIRQYCASDYQAALRSPDFTCP